MEIIFLITSILLIFTGLYDLHVGYGYYVFLRWIVFVSALMFTYKTYKIKPESKLLGISIFAIIFNPIAPIYMSREVWKIIDVITGITFIIALMKYFEIKNK